MARSVPKRKRDKQPLPRAGDAFLMPLADGRFGVCRVIREGAEGDDLGGRAGSVLAVASPWIGTGPPALSARGLRSILMLSHHSWRNEPEVLWVSDPPPPTFRYLGVIKPSAREKQTRCGAWGGWQNFPLQVLLQWRWEHDREALLAEDARAEEANERERKRLAQRQQRYLAGLTLAKLRSKPPFRDWAGFVPPEAIKAARGIFRDTIDRLEALGPKPSKRAARGVLRSCIERFNELDERHDHFIDTIAREDICARFYEIVHVVGLGKYGESELADEWREW